MAKKVTTIQYVDNHTAYIKTPAACKEFMAAIKQIDPKAHWNRQPDKQYWTFNVPSKAKELVESCFKGCKIIEEGSKPSIPSPIPQNCISVNKDIIAQDDSFDGLVFRIQMEMRRLGYKSATINDDFTHTVVANYQVANF